MIDSKKEALEAKMRLLNASKMIERLTADEAFVYLLERLDEKVKTSKQDLESSKNWDDFVDKRGYNRGLLALVSEIDTIISRGKGLERSLKI
jgi:hypothetical protein